MKGRNFCAWEKIVVVYASDNQQNIEVRLKGRL